jgi:excisionase family DNA binding protein
MPTKTAVSAPAELPRFLTVPEAAAVLRLGLSATYEAIARGQIPSVRFGRKIRVPRGVIFQLAREHSVGTGAEQAPDQHEPEAGGIADHTATEQT